LKVLRRDDGERKKTASAPQSTEFTHSLSALPPSVERAANGRNEPLLTIERNLGESTMSKMLSIRPAQPKDHSTIVDIWHAGWHEAHASLVPAGVLEFRTVEYFWVWLENSTDQFYVALSDGVVGQRADESGEWDGSNRLDRCNVFCPSTMPSTITSIYNAIWCSVVYFGSTEST